MNNRDARRVTEIVLEALAATEQRAILGTGWGGLGGLSDANLPEQVFKIESVPFDWLFPRMSAVIHHGGAGTTAEGLRAGVPSVVIPFFSDQPFWARRVYGLGAGTKPIPRQKLTSTQLADAMSIAVSDRDMRARASTLSRSIQSEDGIRRAVTLVRQLHSGRSPL